MLVLLIFYFVFLILLNLAQSGRFSYEFLAYFILIGSINLPLIKYSVDWWNTLHQSQSLTQVYSTIHFTIGTPLLFFNSLFALIYFYLLCRLILNVYIELKVKFFRKF